MFDKKTTKVSCITTIHGQRLILVDVKELPQTLTAEVVLLLQLEPTPEEIKLILSPMFDLPGKLGGPHTINLNSIVAWHTMSKAFQEELIDVAQGVYNQRVTDMSGIILAPAGAENNIKQFKLPMKK